MKKHTNASLVIRSSIAKGDVVIMSRILGAFQTLAGMSNSTIAAVKKGEKQ